MTDFEAFTWTSPLNKQFSVISGCFVTCNFLFACQNLMTTMIVKIDLKNIETMRIRLKSDTHIFS